MGLKRSPGTGRAGREVPAAVRHRRRAIEKNRLGIPLNRFRTGIALYRVPGAKWCQYREFTRVEAFDGTGYVRNDGFNLLAIRYQKCP